MGLENILNVEAFEIIFPEKLMFSTLEFYLTKLYCFIYMSHGKIYLFLFRVKWKIETWFHFDSALGTNPFYQEENFVWKVNMNNKNKIQALPKY